MLNCSRYYAYDVLEISKEVSVFSIRGSNRHDEIHTVTDLHKSNDVYLIPNQRLVETNLIPEFMESLKECGYED